MLSTGFSLWHIKADETPLSASVWATQITRPALRLLKLLSFVSSPRRSSTLTDPRNAEIYSARQMICTCTFASYIRFNGSIVCWDFPTSWVCGIHLRCLSPAELLCCMKGNKRLSASTSALTRAAFPESCLHSAEAPRLNLMCLSIRPIYCSSIEITKNAARAHLHQPFLRIWISAFYVFSQVNGQERWIFDLP